MPSPPHYENLSWAGSHRDRHILEVVSVELLDAKGMRRLEDNADVFDLSHFMADDDIHECGEDGEGSRF